VNVTEMEREGEWEGGKEGGKVGGRVGGRVNRGRRGWIESELKGL
jgi:hypothetical protein